MNAERLRDLLHYDCLTGVFTWIKPPLNQVSSGDVAGSYSCGRGTIGVDGKQYLAHRLAWLYVHGDWPKACIDHIDGNPSNNALLNLRDVTPSVNIQNLKSANKNNACGFLGVSAIGKKFRAVIKLDGIFRHLGVYETAEFAYGKYLSVKRAIHPGCTL